MSFFTWVNVCRRNELWKEVGYMGTLGNRDCQLASRSVLEDFTDDALTISAGSLFQNGIALMATVAATSLFVELISVAA